MSKLTIHILSMSYKHGDNVTLYRDFDEAYGAVKEWVREYWGDYYPDEPMPDDMDEAVDAYFTEHMEEFYSLDFQELDFPEIDGLAIVKDILYTVDDMLEYEPPGPAQVARMIISEFSSGDYDRAHEVADKAMVALKRGDDLQDFDPDAEEENDDE